MGKIDIYNLGQLGVNVDADDIHLKDGELRESQNFQLDPAGGLGGIRRRDGMTALNSSALAGDVTGVIALPLTNQAALARKFYIPYNDNNVGSNTWRTSTDGTTWTSVTTGAKPQQDEDLGAVGLLLGGAALRWTTLENKIYFPGHAYKTTSTNPTVDVFDGTTSAVLAQIPPNPNTATTTPIGIFSIVPYSKTQLLVSTFDSTTGNGRSRVMILDIQTGSLAQLGPETDIQSMILQPFVIAGRVWIGTYNNGGSAASTVRWIRPGDPTWTTDHTTSTALGYCYGMTSFLGNIYAGFGADAGTSAVIKQRTSDGVWSTVHTSDGTGASNYCGPLITSKDGLTAYAYRWSVSGGAAPIGRVLKSTDGASWTQDYDAGGVAGESQSGQPILDPDDSGFVWWALTDVTGTSAGSLLRNNAGTYTNVDEQTTGRGPICWLRV